MIMSCFFITINLKCFLNHCESEPACFLCIRFVYVPCPHNADVICQALHECLVDWPLEKKVSTILLTTAQQMIRLSTFCEKSWLLNLLWSRVNICICVVVHIYQI